MAALREHTTPAVSESAGQTPWQLPFVLLAAMWGSSFLLIKVLVEAGWSAPWVALGRVALGALTLLALVAWRRERLPTGRRLWGHLAILSLLWNALPFTLFAYGETRIPSVLAGLCNATTPLLTLVVALVAFPEEERPTRGRLVGVAVGFAGVVVVLGPWRGMSDGSLLGQLACLGAASCYAIAIPYTRRHLAGRSEGAISLVAAQLLCATAALALVAPFARAPRLDAGIDAAGALLALGVLSTGLAFAIMQRLVSRAGTAIASLVPYLIPVFSTLLGVLVLSEGLSANEPIGAAIVLIGIAISQDRFRRTRR
jgi:drug/metabolite transporter (DMT)-like permease